MPEIKVLFFATFKDMVGAKEIMLDIPENASIANFKTILTKKYPALAPLAPSMLIAVNNEYAFDEETIPDNAEIALFPPVSGGGSFPEIFKVTEGELDLNGIIAQITLPTTGAACFFTGMVRAVTKRGEGHQTEYLEYESYIPMAEAKMAQVAEEIRKKWPAVEGIAMVQRIGHLEPGTPTVMIACTAGHRDTGVFEAARYGIDRLKQIVPIWKKEVGTNGEVWIEGEYHPQPGE